MANGSGAIPPHVAAFNSKVSELIKSAQPHEIADLISHPASLLKMAADDNQNQNQGGKSEE